MHTCLVLCTGIVAACLLLGLARTSVRAGPGSCQQFQFPRRADGRVDWPHTVKVIRHDAPVYDGAASAAATGTLAFNSSFRVLDAQDERVQLGHGATLEAVGWVDRTALLCGLLPLTGQTGLEQKFYVHPPGDPAVGVQAYPGPDLQTCADQCRELRYFESYVVFAYDERSSAYLLSDAYTLDDTSHLIGWVSQADGVVWDTGYGLRPRDDLVFPAEHPLAGLGQITCAYATIKEALQPAVNRCLPLRGGPSWYRSAYRIPLLERVSAADRAFYKVLVPLADSTAQTANPESHPVLAYLPVSDEIVEDIWLRSNDLDKWLSLLRALEDAALDELWGEELRQAFVFMLVDALEDALRLPFYENTAEPLGAYLQRQAGLPVRHDSPLFRYSINALMDPKQVPDCEMTRLVAWVNHSRQMLEIVYHGTTRPAYAKEAFPGECPTGGNIPFLSSDIRAAPLGDDPAMRYDHTVQKARVYWAPKHYLP